MPFSTFCRQQLEFGLIQGAEQETVLLDSGYAITARDGILLACDCVLRQAACVEVHILQAQVEWGPGERASVHHGGILSARSREGASHTTNASS